MTSLLQKRVNQGTVGEFVTGLTLLIVSFWFCGVCDVGSRFDDVVNRIHDVTLRTYDVISRHSTD